MAYSIFHIPFGKGVQASEPTLKASGIAAAATGTWEFMEYGIFHIPYSFWEGVQASGPSRTASGIAAAATVTWEFMEYAIFHFFGGGQASSKASSRACVRLNSAAWSFWNCTEFKVAHGASSASGTNEAGVASSDGPSLGTWDKRCMRGNSCACQACQELEAAPCRASLKRPSRLGS